MRTDWQLAIPWNLRLFWHIYGHRHRLLDRWYASYFHFGKGYAVLLFAPLFYRLAGPRAAVHVLIASLCAGLAARAIKLLVQHKRPSRLLPGISPSERIYSRSFPSGDAALAFAIFGTGLWHLPWWTAAILGGYALLIAYGRIYRGVHFPLDVLVGAGVGLAMTVLANDFSAYLAYRLTP